MNQKTKILISLIFTIILFGGFSTDKKKRPQSVEKYIQRFKNLAKSEQTKFGIPASITIAQGILESKAGRSKLTLKTNNHFGIKCFIGCNHKNSYNMADDKPTDRFKIYATSWESFRDHSKLLMIKRYKKCRQCGNDYKCWAKNLQKAGYATSKKYSKDIIQIIEYYKLYELDK